MLMQITNQQKQLVQFPNLFQENLSNWYVRFVDVVFGKVNMLKTKLQPIKHLYLFA